MTFLAPWAMWFLAGIPVIVLLYLLKLKRRPVTVSTLMFWQRALQESRRRALFQRLRNLLSLLLHLLIFLLIVAALARPALDHLIRAGASTVLIVDTRARMQAVDENGASRISRARQLASSYVKDAGGDREFAVLSAGAATEVKVPFSSDEKALNQALAQLEASDAAGDLEPALRLAQDLLATRKGDRQILVFTDREEPVNGAPPANHPSPITNHAPTRHLPIPARADNVAITRLATRPLLNSPQTSEVLIELRNFGPAAVSGNVEIAYDGTLLDVKPVTLAPGARRLEVFASVPRASRNSQGWLTARIDVADALASDNRAFAVLPPLRTPRVLLVSAGNWFLEKLLAADQSVRFELLTPEGFRLEMATTFDVVILDAVQLEGVDLNTLAGNLLFLNETPFRTGEAAIEQPVITEADAGHPALRLANLQNVTIARATAAALPKEAGDWRFQIPLAALDQPLMITGERRSANARQRLAALSFDLAESDLPIRVAFPLLISNTIQWLAGENNDAPRALLAGETMALSAEQSASAQPQTEAAAPAVGAEVRSLFQPLQNGFYALRSGDQSGWVAVNTFNEDESDVQPGDSPASAISNGQTAALTVALTSWPIWRYLALAAFLLFALEWWLFHRRRTE